MLCGNCDVVWGWGVDVGGGCQCLCMDIIFIFGFWFDVFSWEDVMLVFEWVGYWMYLLFFFGLGELVFVLVGIGIVDWIVVVVVVVDVVLGEVVVVGYSGGGNVVWGVVDVCLDWVWWVVFVDIVFLFVGMGISEFMIVDGVVLFFGWDFFFEEDVYDFDEFICVCMVFFIWSVLVCVLIDGIMLENLD